MKALCSIIRDILPLYYDNVCSRESRAMVEEHLNECAECNEVLNALSDELTHPADTTDEAKPIKLIKEGIEKRKRRSVRNGVIISVLVCAILTGGYFILTQQRNLSIDYISTFGGPYVLSDGRVVFQYKFDDRVQSVLLAGYDGIGTVHMIPRGSIIGRGWSPRQNVFQGSNAVWCVTVYRDYIVIEPSDITAFYIGFGDNEILIWERGLELPPASAELELFFAVNDEPIIDRNDAGVGENSHAVPMVKELFFNLTQDGALTVSADELSEYQLYTNSKRIRITIPKGDYEGTFELYDVHNESDSIMVMELDQRKRTGTFEHLTAAKNYYIVVDNTEPDVLITVTD